MDYLVFGVGFGSSLVLLGWLLRQFGPALRYPADGEEATNVLGAEALIARQDWRTFCTAVGAILSVSGAVMVIVTIATLLIRPSDGTGSIVVGIVFALTLIGIAAWIALFVSQHDNMNVSDVGSIVRRFRPGRAASTTTTDESEEGSKGREEDAAHPESAATSETPAPSDPAAPARRVASNARPAGSDAPSRRADNPAPMIGPPVPVRRQTGSTPPVGPAAPPRRVVNPARPSSTAHPQAGVQRRAASQARMENDGSTDAAKAAAAGEQNLLAGVRFTRARLGKPETATTPPSVAASRPPQAATAMPSPVLSPAGGEDVVASVRMKDAPQEDPPVKQTPGSTNGADRPTATSAEPTQATPDGSSRETALANLRLRRAGRQVPRDS